MTGAIIITLCALLLLSYVFDITASKSKLPSVILLLILGWAIRQLTNTLHVAIPNLSPVLPLLGTIGLILIVLEGALELEFNRARLPLIIKSSLIAILSILTLSLTISTAFYYFTHTDFRICLINAIPFAIISSAIAIPSSKNLSAKNREFVIYESSMSDIFGVILFNFLLYNDNFGLNVLSSFILQIIVIILLSFLVTFGLLLLLRQLKHQVKYTPIVLFIILVYSISKELHLPALLFILALGLILANIEKLAHFSIIQKLQPEILKVEVNRLKELTIEITFLIRSLFFLLFGFLIETAKLIEIRTITWALCIFVMIYLIRWGLLKIFNLPNHPLLYIAPRGLITILLFLSIPGIYALPLVSDSMITQIIILSALFMVMGMFGKKSSNLTDSKKAASPSNQ
ncbi:MAG: hypothetical protein ACP5PZ_02460 [Bacteroidales bacterium]